MNDNLEFEKNVKVLIDDLKSVCANYGLGNDGNEFKIITQLFLYKFLNDRFIKEVKLIDKNLSDSKNIFDKLDNYNKKDFEMLLMQMDENTARLYPNQLISHIYTKQNEDNFSSIFDNNLLEIGNQNSDIFSVLTSNGERIILFENISKYISDKRDDFCRAAINKLINFSFENFFDQKFDFYSVIFEYLIKDYNSNSGGKYGEYFTPHVVAKIMSKCLVKDNEQDVTCYDPSSGSGTLLMNLAHTIGEDKCILYSEDISQKSSNLLRLNLIINKLVHSIPNIIQGNTILMPYHRSNKGSQKKFDYIVSNPPFKLDFSDYRNELDTKDNNERFFAGIPKIPKKNKDKMPIYLLFIQHILFSLSEKGKAAVVVPSGFLTVKSGIEYKIRKFLIDEKILKSVISMPSNIFATTGTSVSILFFDKSKNFSEVNLMDASKLGTSVKEGKYQKTIISEQEEILITETIINNKSIDDLSTKVSFESIKKKNYSFNAGHYFKIKIQYEDISIDDFNKKILSIKNELNKLFQENKDLGKKIDNQIDNLKYEKLD